MKSVRPVSLAAAMLLCLGSRQANAQNVRQLAAWDGLMLSPAGALAPVASDPAVAGRPGDVISLRYGRWQYDSDDAVHDNLGLTWARRFAFARSEVALTGAYVEVECGGCFGWMVLGLSARSTVLRFESASDPDRSVRVSAAIRLDVGGARYHGAEGSATFSTTATAPIEFVVPLSWTKSIGLALTPGIGYGSVSGSGLSESGIVPMMGGAVAWAISSHATLNFGVQRVIIKRSNTQVGAAISWSPGKTERVSR